MSETFSSLGRSDELPELLRLLQNHQVFTSLATPPPRVRLIADTNVILNDLRWYNRKQKVTNARTSFLEAAHSGIAVIYAPTQVRAEVLAHFEEFYQEFRIPVEALRASWKPYEQAIKWLDPRASKRTERDVHRKTERDPTDAPCVALSIQIGAGVLSHDLDYTSFGVTYYRPEVTESLRGHARATVREIQLKLGATGALFVSGGLTVAAVRGFGKLPLRVQLLCAGALLLSCAHDGTRRWLLRNVDALKGAGIELLGEFVADLNRTETERKNNPIEDLRPTKPQTLADYIAVAVAESKDPITSAEIARCVLQEGYPTKSEDFERLISSYLRRDPRLRRTSTGWILVPLPTPNDSESETRI